MFIGSRPILYLLILLPAVLIIRSQLENLFEALEKEQQKSRKDSESGRIPLQ